MNHRQSDIPGQWLIVDARSDEWSSALRRLPIGSGVLVLHHDLPKAERQRLIRTLRRLGRNRGLLVVDESGGGVARVHDAGEIARARLAGARLLLLSPIFATRSHRDWPSLPRMRAAALSRLAGGPLLALGGMNAKRFARVKALGFHGWAGIDAWAGARRGRRSRE